MAHLGTRNAPVPEGLRNSTIFPLQLLGITGTVTTAAGSIYVYGGTKNQASGHTMMVVGTFALILTFLFDILLSLITLRNTTIHFYKEGKNVIYCLLACTPFVFVRLVYSMISVFVEEGSVFRLLTDTSGAIWLNFSMVTIMEWLVAFNVIVTGFLTEYKDIADDKVVLLTEMNSRPPKSAGSVWGV
jgi:hypothetical protein